MPRWSISAVSGATSSLTPSIATSCIQGSRPRRQVEHTRVGAALEQLFASDVDPWLDTLALHYEQASTTPEHRQKAIDFLRRAARRAQSQLANDHAVRFYRRALQAVERMEPPDAGLRCDVLIELGTAERRSGLDSFRGTLLEATACAHELGDGTRAARAVLGASRGIFSIAGSIDNDRVQSLRRTLELIGTEPSAVRARLLATLGAELTFDDDPRAAEAVSDEAMAIARGVGDLSTLVTAISLRTVALWRADRVEERLALGAELDAIRQSVGAERSGQFLNAMNSYCQSAMEAGDFETADRLLPWIEATAGELRQPTSVGFAKLRLASRACIAGRLDEAERLAEEVFELSSHAGHPDADAFYTGHMFTIRLHQGRLDEAAEMVERSARQYPGVRAFPAAAAVCACEHDDLDRARVWFAEAANDLDSIRFDLNWLTAMTMLAIPAARLADRTAAADVRARLQPYRRQFVDNASTFFGSVEHYYGLLSATLEDDEATDEAFAAALQAHARLGSPPLLARSQLDFAEALAARSHPPVDRVIALAQAAARVADDRGYATISRRSRDVLARVGAAAH